MRRIFPFPAAGQFGSLAAVNQDTKGKRKPPRGGYRAGMRRDALRRRLKLVGLIVIGGAVVAGLVYLNFVR